MSSCEIQQSVRFGSNWSNSSIDIIAPQPTIQRDTEKGRGRAAHDSAPQIVIVIATVNCSPFVLHFVILGLLLFVVLPRYILAYQLSGLYTIYYIYTCICLPLCLLWPPLLSLCLCQS